MSRNRMGFELRVETFGERATADAAIWLERLYKYGPDDPDTRQAERDYNDACSLMVRNGYQIEEAALWAAVKQTELHILRCRAKANAARHAAEQAQRQEELAAWREALPKRGLLGRVGKALLGWAMP